MRGWWRHGPRALVGFTLMIVLVTITTAQPLPELRVRAIEGPDTIEAGESVTVEVTATGRTGTVRLIARAGLVVHELQASVIDGRASISLPRSTTATAGLLTVSSWSSELSIHVTPGPVTEGSRPIVGPRTIVADGLDATLGVALPGDRFGNASPDGTMVMFHHRAPDGSLERTGVVTVDGVAWTGVDSGTLTGTSEIWIDVGGVAGLPAIIGQVAGRAAAVEIDVPADLPAADGTSRVVLTSPTVVDAFGNGLPDGVAADFVIESATGVDRVPAVIENGRLRAEWTVPSNPGLVQIRCVINGRSSDRVSRRVRSAVGELPVSAAHDEAATVVVVGPVLGPSGAVIDDGTPVVAGGRVAALYEGMATILLPLDTTEIEVSVLGFVVDVAVES